MKIKDEVIKKTCCRSCLYHCGVRAHVRDEEIAGVEGDWGNLVGMSWLCVKARAALGPS